MRLNVGEKAPEFNAMDILGEQIDLRDYVGKKLLLSFFRFSKCPYCNLRVSRMLSRFQTYHEAGLEMVAVFESPRESMLGGVAKQQPPFPLIADPNNEVYRAYGVEISKFHMLEAYLNPIKAAKVLSDSFSALLGKGFWPTKIDGPIARMPADFVIGPDLIIERAYYGTYLSDHLPFEEIERSLMLRQDTAEQTAAAPS